MVKQIDTKGEDLFDRSTVLQSMRRTNYAIIIIEFCFLEALARLYGTCRAVAQVEIFSENSRVEADSISISTALRVFNKSRINDCCWGRNNKYSKIEETSIGINI